jgi:hypothetical protein
MTPHAYFSRTKRNHEGAASENYWFGLRVSKVLSYQCRCSHNAGPNRKSKSEPFGVCIKFAFIHALVPK